MKFPKTEPYVSFIIDDEPIVRESLYQKNSLKDIMGKQEKEIKPIKRRVPFEYVGDCIHCGAPNDYLYKHTKAQNKCTVCERTFTSHPNYHEEITQHFPHCELKLSLHHEQSFL